MGDLLLVYVPYVTTVLELLTAFEKRAENDIGGF